VKDPSAFGSTSRNGMTSRRETVGEAHRSFGRRPRVAFYSQDAVGFGHLRRNMLIAQTLARSELAATSLLVSGAHEANFFKLPPGVDCVTLPRIGKDPSGKYRSARLDISLEELAKCRRALIRSALQEFDPDVMIVDFRPTGVCDELLPALESLARRQHTRCILGLRDVIDDVSVVQDEWLSRQKIDAMERYYSEVWIYGDPHVFDPVREYKFPESIACKTRFTGYLNQCARLSDSWKNNNGAANSMGALHRETVACVVGGGQDGGQLIETFIDAVPPEIDAIVLTGPYVPQPVLQAARQAAKLMPNLQILEFTPEADWIIARADRVVGMAGYNTVCSILSFGKPALLVPRVKPRREQGIRAEIMSKLQLADVIAPDCLTVGNLGDWLRQPGRHVQRAEDLLDLNGLDRIVSWFPALLPVESERVEEALPPFSCNLSAQR
jgi:predicted glycosyltransferase